MSSNDLLEAMIQRCMARLSAAGLGAWQARVREWFVNASRHGLHQQWLDILAQLPPASKHTVVDCASVRVGGPPPDTRRLRDLLSQLAPWRKGPFRFFDVTVDSEWRSDWKWQRLQAHVDLTGCLVLDVGCGNGYYGLRMLAQGATAVVGVDPLWLYQIQYQAFDHYAREPRFTILPCPMESLPQTEAFDAVFSMGVIYHRKSPFEHLLSLKKFLKPGGQLLLESIVVEGDRHTVLTPGERYARMKNVWMIPSTEALLSWLEKTGWTDAAVLDVTVTTMEEQRRTEWMQHESLQQALDPVDGGKTIEGYPAPRRAIVRARRK